MTIDEVLEKCRKTAAWNGELISHLEQRNELDDTPLHTVCSWGDFEAVKILIENGADVNARGDKGSTALFNAIIGRNTDVIILLLKNGANPSIKNDWGITPIDYAIAVSAPKYLINSLNKNK